jgi:hypothetical protein
MRQLTGYGMENRGLSPGIYVEHDFPLGHHVQMRYGTQPESCTVKLILLSVAVERN